MARSGHWFGGEPFPPARCCRGCTWRKAILQVCVPEAQREWRACRPPEIRAQPRPQAQNRRVLRPRPQSALAVRLPARCSLCRCPRWHWAAAGASPAALILGRPLLPIICTKGSTDETLSSVGRSCQLFAPREAPTTLCRAGASPGGGDGVFQSVSSMSVFAGSSNATRKAAGGAPKQCGQTWWR